MKRYVILIFLALACMQGIAGSDSTKLHFHSELERKYLGEFIRSGQLNRLAILLSVDSTATEDHLEKLSKDFNELIQSIDKKVRGEKTTSKKVKYIFSTIHNNYLRKYILGTSFREIFSSGAYNCVSGSALYGLIFDNYGIPFEVKETPTHVYLVVNADGEKITVESTDPNMGYFKPDDKFKKQYVDYLVKVKLVTQDEVSRKGTDKIFNENYYDNDKITLDQLVGLQYYNYGIEAASNKNFPLAYNYFEKAHRIYSSEKIKYLSTLCLAAQLDNSTFSELADVDNLINLYNSLEGEEQEKFVNQFAQITQKYLIELNKAEYYDKVYARLTAGISDTSFLKQIALIYNWEHGRASYLKGDYKGAMTYLAEAIKVSPENLELQSMMSSCLLEGLRYVNDYAKGIKILDENVAQYPFLADNPNTLKAYSIYYLLIAAAKFEGDNRQEGIKYLKKFEGLKDNKEFPMPDEVIGGAYGAAWASYARAGQRDVAKSYIQKGLKYAPYSEELNHKMKVIQDSAK